MQLWNVPKKDRGFTLVEMLAAAGIISVLAAVAVPNLLGAIYKSNLSDGVAKIEGAIKEAQRQAIRNSRSCSIEITTNFGGKAVVQNQGTDNCLLETRVLTEDITVTNNTANSTFLEIDISSKGNIGNTSEYVPPDTGNWTIVVSHNNIPTQKCVRVEGLFGDIQTGIFQGGVCDTN